MGRLMELSGRAAFAAISAHWHSFHGIVPLAVPC